MDICIDSRKIKEGDIFFCIEGVETDGHKFVDSAIKNGAKKIVHSQDIEKKVEGVEYVKVEDTLEALNQACNEFYGKPSEKLTMFGITGTNGKSSIANIISQVYSKKELCGCIGTIAIKLGDKVKAPDLTTPDSVTMHKTLKDMLNDGAKAVAIEVSSQGLDRGRVNSIDFDCAIFTNLTHDHLDYHKTMEAYFEAKKILFKLMKKTGVAILNKDDYTYEGLTECTKCRCVSYGIRKEADYMAKNINFMEFGTTFTLVYNGNEYPVSTNMSAEYNVYNLLASIAAMHEAGMEIDEILTGVKSIDQIPGRMERIDKGQPFEVIVDYAHTPDGFEKIFTYAKEITKGKGRIFGVFGAAGHRDTSKRKTFGIIASKYCDKIFLTEQDTRNEDPANIANEIIEGISNTEYVFIEKRKEAIETAISEARVGDCVLMLGKGDEAFLYDEKGRIPWDGDNNVARLALEKIGWR